MGKVKNPPIEDPQSGFSEPPITQASPPHILSAKETIQGQLMLKAAFSVCHEMEDPQEAEVVSPDQPSLQREPCPLPSC